MSMNFDEYFYEKLGKFMTPKFICIFSQSFSLSFIISQHLIKKL